MNIDINRIRENLDVLKTDIRAQMNCLKNNNDVYWDCYNVNSWDSLLAIVNDIRKELNLMTKVCPDCKDDNITNYWNEVEEKHEFFCNNCNEYTYLIKVENET